MSYKIGNRLNGGYNYVITHNGCVMTGWRTGTLEAVEAYVKRTVFMIDQRSYGKVVKLTAGGDLRTSHFRGGTRNKKSVAPTDALDDAE